MRLIEGEGKRAGGFLARLSRDKRGNVIAIMAIALIPVSAFAGSAVDMGRLYVVRTRLQQACDAGALAARKFMIDDADTTLDANARTQATTFFSNNFKDGWLGTRATTSTFNETGNNQVVGTAQTVVPMTIMKMFSSPDRTIQVTCNARLDIPDVDVMLVLDTTGSMACAPNEPGNCSQSGTKMTYTRTDGSKGYAAQEKSTSRIVGLRAAVLNFYNTMKSTADAASHIRYGIVPYTSTVNIGYELPADFLVSSHSYRSRRIVADSNYGATFDQTFDKTKKTDCDALAGRYPAAPLKFDTNGDAQRKTVKSWVTTGGGTCVLTVQPLVPMWRFGPSTADVSAYIKREQVQDPSKYTVSLNKWQGCIEERPTVAASSFNVANLPADLDPDLPPTSDATRWRPMWPEQIYDHTGERTWGLEQADNNFVAGKSPGDRSGSYYNAWADPNYLAGGFVSCGKSAKRLGEMTQSEMSTFLNAPEFRPLGGTYHDTGMIWATRLMSPTGPFAGDTAPWPGRGEPNRNIIFMTDGEMAPNELIYGMYGLERWDERVGGKDASQATLKARHNARFRAVCDAARANGRNITVWVIAFGQALDPDLVGCAHSPQHAFEANSTDKLNEAFQKIAKQIGALRIYNQ